MLKQQEAMALSGCTLRSRRKKLNQRSATKGCFCCCCCSVKRAKRILLSLVIIFTLDVIINPDDEFIPYEENLDETEPCWRNPNLTQVEVATWDYYPKLKQRVKEPALNPSPEACTDQKINFSPPPRRPPSQGACDGYDGVFHIQHGDLGGASGTIFFQFVVGMLQWADQHNFLPWIHLSNYSIKVYDTALHSQGPETRFTMMDGMKIGVARDERDRRGCVFPGKVHVEESLRPKEFVFEGTGVWEHYFQPVNDFVPGDPSCRDKPFVWMDDIMVYVGIHSHAPWAPHPWRYGNMMPKYIERNDLTLKEFLEPQRIHAAETTQRHIRFNAEMEQRAACAHPNPKNSLGMHIRHTDKELTYRRNVKLEEFLPYCEAFVDDGGGDIFLATDSALVLEEIYEKWPKRVTSHIVRQQQMEGLSRNGTGAFDLGISTHRSNTEALTDLLALSKCTYLLHGLSAFTEAILWLNPGLMERALNLEDDESAYTANYFKETILPRGKNVAS